MRIGFDASDLYTGRADGTTRYTYEILKRLPALLPNDEWHVFAPSPQPPQYALPPVHWHSSPWPKYWTQSRLPFDLLKYRPDVLFMPIQQLPILRPWGTKTVSVIHDLSFHQYGKQTAYKDWLLLHVFSAQVAREADHIIAISQSTANDIAHFYGRRKNVHVIPHGVDHTAFYPAGEQEKVTSWHQLHEAFPRLKKPYILTVGQIQPRKNIVRLIEAFEQLTQNKAYANYQLVIAGGHGWLQEPIMQRAKTSTKATSIHLLGSVPDNLLLPLYWHADVFALVSLYEGFGLPLLEALAAGTPVVTSNVSSMPEVVGEAGVLVNPRQTGSIREGLAQALKNAQGMREQGITQANKFTWEKSAEMVAQLLQRGA